jgi:hypothetical protein
VYRVIAIDENRSLAEVEVVDVLGLPYGTRLMLTLASVASMSLIEGEQS